MGLTDLFGKLHGGKKPGPGVSTGLTAREWILANTDATLEVVELGHFDTAAGQAAFLDPLAFYQTPDWVEVPREGGQLVVFHDPEQGRNSQLAIVFGNMHIWAGADVATCAVDAGMGSIFTPSTHAAQAEFANELGPDKNLYDDYFCTFDDKAGGERKIVELPDGTPVPYVHSGWGDGAYPVFTLTTENGGVVAVYTDFMGCDEDGNYLLPPGVTLDNT